MKATRLLITGIVQGVGFRYFAERSARELGLAGYVRNLQDGRVEVVASGPVERVRQLIDRLRIGPRAGKVDAIEILETDLEDGCDGFEIRF